MALLSHVRALALAAVVAFVTVPPGLATFRAEGLPRSSHSERARSMVELANVQRTQAGLSPLRANDRLMQAAQLQAEQSATIGKLAHVIPEGRYPRPVDRLDASGYAWRAYGENIAYGQADPSSATVAWMKSSEHRKNLLNPNYTEVGTGYALDGTGHPYYVQVFGRPS